MTREEAIKWLKYCAETDCDGCVYEIQPVEWCCEKMAYCVSVLEEALTEPSNTPTESTNTLTDAPIEALKADVARWSSWNKTFEQSGIADLISRAEAIEALCRSSVYAWSTEQDLVAHSWAIRIIQSLPSADRPQGEWIIDTYNMELKCGICGEIFRFDDVDELLDYKEYAKYCLACGSQMGGAE